MAFNNPHGLYALLALIPFILLHLRRPKPKEKTIPSLMFFMKEKGVTKFSNLFRQILRNLLFLVQLAILLSAAFAAASPFFTSEKAATAKQTVLVIDGSASMNAMLSTGSTTRFEKALAEAGSRVEGDASVILATNIPVVVMERGTSTDAKKALSLLKSRATETHIGDSMLAAGELVEDPSKSKIVVVSDFQASQGTDIIVAKRSLTARGINVELVNVLSDKGTDAPLSTLDNAKDELSGLSNAGFVQVDVNKFQTTALVKNYDDNSRGIDVEITNNGKEVSTQRLTIGPRSLEPVSFDTMSGKTQLRIMQEDDLPTDNTAFVSSPTKRVRALLITNSDASYVMSALKSSPNVQLDVAFPPVVKGFGYDVIIVHNASSQYMLPGFYKEINKAVSNGTGLVVTAQDSMPAFVKQLNMPLALYGMKNSSKATVKIENSLTKGVDFGVVAKYYQATVQGKDSAFTTLVAADDDTPLIGTYPSGNGLVLYYGLFDDASSFRSSYSYPIFWDGMLGFLTRSDNVASFNVLTGNVEGISEQQVETPSGKIKTARLFYDEAGYYTMGTRVVAANLANMEESNIRSTGGLELASENSAMQSTGTKAKAQLALENKLIIAAILLLALELLIVKMRGDL